MNEKLIKFKELYFKNFSLKDIAFELGISYATAKRYKHIVVDGLGIFDKKKKVSFKKGNFLLSKEEIMYIIDFYNNNTYYFNMKHFHEHFVINQMGYNISYSTLKRYFSLYQVETRKTRKKLKEDGLP